MRPLIGGFLHPGADTVAVLSHEDTRWPTNNALSELTGLSRGYDVIYRRET